MELGKSFPEFSLPNQDGKTIKLTDFRGKWLVLYVYPKDDTPGCTIQAKAFTANDERFEKENIKVVGLSQDAVDSHKNFCNKFALTIDLVSDTDGKLLKATGVGQTEWKGTMYWDRTTFVIDPSGILVKRYDKVTPEGHDLVLLDDIKELKTQSVVSGT
ncbi:MAG: peroxiredoxin [Candidatus Obscuribacterales bacterium]|nr:peroxiredoxin [Candidatus Obscuribacterales bacterium]